MSNKLISVIIPTYGRPQTLGRAINSVLNQTYQNIEVIVVDDNNPGTDARSETEKTMQEFAANDKVKYLQHEYNKNGSAARNTGILSAGGAYIAFLDDDDTFRPERLQQMYDKMETLDETWGACYTGYVKHMENDTLQYSAEKNEGELFVQCLMRALYIGTGSNLFFRRSVVDDIGLFDVSFRRNQDLEYLVRVLKKYKMAYVDEVLMDAYYDVRTNNPTFEQSWEREQMFREKFAYHLEDLQPKEKRAVLAMYELDWMRQCVAFKKYGEIIKVALRAKIPLKVYFAYIKYARDRIKNKTSYGFAVKI